MDDDILFLWFLPAMFLLQVTHGLTQTRGRLNLAVSTLFVLIVAYLVITFTLAGGRPPAELVLVTSFGVLYLVETAVRARVKGLDVFLDSDYFGSGRPLQGIWTVARVRGRLNRALRRTPEPDTSVADDAALGDMVVAAAREAGRGDLVAAVNRLDTALSPAEPPSSWPDARLGLMLYHRTVYSALATVVGDSPAQSTRWRNDLDLARTVLPDVRLGWLADSAVAVAEGRLWPAVYATDALLVDSRGPWEKGLGAVVGRLARDVPDPYREGRYARLVERNPWVAHLATRLELVGTHG